MRTGYSSERVIELLEADGWYVVAQEGAHMHFRHPRKPGRVTVQHPLKDVPAATRRSIADQAGIKID
ncbi:MAG TPA: type II toxin-antitoxin system HicA family toxin [Alphaproteobacteria bacterium]|nr:type II toxin-antitoxin system HicA family toxin [Alphaproteobacteria bacterium]